MGPKLHRNDRNKISHCKRAKKIHRMSNSFPALHCSVPTQMNERPNYTFVSDEKRSGPSSTFLPSLPLFLSHSASSFSAPFLSKTPRARKLLHLMPDGASSRMLHRLFLHLHRRLDRENFNVFLAEFSRSKDQRSS